MNNELFNEIVETHKSYKSLYEEDHIISMSADHVHVDNRTFTNIRLFKNVHISQIEIDTSYGNRMRASFFADGTEFITLMDI